MSKNKRKQPIAYVEPPEPPFLKRMKAQLGFKEGPNVDTKREEQELDLDRDEALDRDDEKPTVVVLKSGDLTEDEATSINSNILKDPDEDDLDRKVKFKKPTKKSEVDEAAEKIKSKLEKKESQMAQVKNKSLLSFDDEEDDDDGD